MDRLLHGNLVATVLLCGFFICIVLGFCAGRFSDLQMDMMIAAGIVVFGAITMSRRSPRTDG